jgi:cyclase
MRRPRVIPTLLLSKNRLVKTRKFTNEIYIGDPVNAVKIFNDKEVDEISIFDINASRLECEPNYELIAEMAGEAFMPVSYGGGIRSIEQIRKIIRLGVEKVVINTMATQSTKVIKSAVDIFGSQALVGGIDVRQKFMRGYTVVSKSGTFDTKLKLNQHIESLIEAGVGEIFINNIDRDGLMIGYDMHLVKMLSKVSVPVVVCGGAGTLEHLREAIHEGGASAVAAGSMFVLQGKHRAVLISYPNENDLKFLNS